MFVLPRAAICFCQLKKIAEKIEKNNFDASPTNLFFWYFFSTLVCAMSMLVCAVFGIVPMCIVSEKLNNIYLLSPAILFLELFLVR